MFIHGESGSLHVDEYRTLHAIALRDGREGCGRFDMLWTDNQRFGKQVLTWILRMMRAGLLCMFLRRGNNGML